MYRAYHAMRGSGLSGPGGKSTHAVYIFVTMLRKLVADHHPEYLAASFDLAAFKGIPHKDVEVVVFMTDTGEHKCKISEKERKALK